MIIYTTDDDSIHNGIVQGMLRKWCTVNNISSFQIIPCENGRELLVKIAGQTPDLITLDINMPILDGLSTLVKIRSTDRSIPIIMVSSEKESNIGRHTSASEKTNNVDESQKKVLLQRVIDRVIAGAKEPGKINSVLEAVSTLKMNPVQVAMAQGADAYVQKPYQAEDVDATLAKMKHRFKVPI